MLIYYFIYYSWYSMYAILGIVYYRTTTNNCMGALKVLKSKIRQFKCVFYGVLRVVKMTSMAKFNEITKHA